MQKMGKVLVVDDDERLLRVIERMLTRAGYEAVTTTNPEEGIALASKEKTEVVITDTVMPHMNGYEVLKKLLAQNRLIQVIVISGFIEPIKVLDAYSAGASDYLFKPIVERELIETVERAVCRYHRWHNLVCSSFKHPEEGGDTAY